MYNGIQTVEPVDRHAVAERQHEVDAAPAVDRQVPDLERVVTRRLRQRLEDERRAVGGVPQQPGAPTERARIPVPPSPPS